MQKDYLTARLVRRSGIFERGQFWKTAAKSVSFLLVLFSASYAPLYAQPSNDECFSAIALTNVQNWCSAPAAYTTGGATLSASVPRPVCFPFGTTAPDVWFSFIPQASDLRVSVKGAAGQNPGGTLQSPQIAIYTGSCSSPILVYCASDKLGLNYVELLASGLEAGRRYFMRVSGRNDFRGTFQLCLNNYTPFLNPLADCPSGQVLCNTAPMTVEFVSGEGLDANELNNVCGRTGCQPVEYQSTWLKWRAGTSGSLTFNITPLNPSDDLDFVLFELPNGLDNCTGRVSLRCMSSGENIGQPISNWVACTGATGLRGGETDQVEYCGCSTGDNNFLAPVNMTAGKSYALAVVNYSRSGRGFRIEFGGTGTFSGAVSGVDPIQVLSVDKKVSRPFFPASPSMDTTVNYAFRLINTSSAPFTIDSIADFLPEPFSYQGLNPQSEVTAAKSASVPPIGANGNLRWIGAAVSGNPPIKEYYLAPQDTLDLSYRARIPAGTPIGMYTGSVRAFTSGCPLPAMPASVNIGVLCPMISGNITGTAGICAGGGSGTLQVSELENMRLSAFGGQDYGIRFVYFNTPTVANVYGTPAGVLGNALLNADGDKATLDNVVLPSTPGIYYVYAILSPTPTAQTCRPYAGPFLVRVFSEALVNISGATSTCPGGSVTLNATVDGGVGDCVIQWQSQNTVTGAWTNIIGASGSSLTVSPATTTRYRVVLSCIGGGCAQAVSNVQEVAIQTDRTISLSAPASVCVGGQITLTANVPGGLNGCTVLWQLSNNGSAWVNISSTSTASITYSPTGTFLYRAQLVCTSTGCIIPSNTVTVQMVQSQEVVISSGDGVVCLGGTASLTATVSGGAGSCSLTWQQSTDNGLSWAVVPGATGSVFQGSPQVNTQYRAIYNCPAESCLPDTSNIVTISVIADPRIRISGGKTVCAGASVELTASVIRGVGTCTVTWQAWNSELAVWEELSGVTGSRLSVIPQKTTIYRARYFCNGSGCDEVLSNQDTVSVLAGPTAVISGASELCPGNTGMLIATRTGGMGLCFTQWQRLNPVTGAWDIVIGATKDTLIVTGSTTETQYRVTYSCDGDGCSQGISGVFTVRPTGQRAVTITGPPRICAGSTATVTTNGVLSGCTLQWRFFDTNMQAWTDIPGATFISLQVSPTTTTEYQLSYRCGEGACVEGVSNTIRIEVNPSPSAQVNGPASICAGQSAQLSATVTNTFTSCTLTWQSSLNGQTWTAVPNAAGLNISVSPPSNIYYRIVYDCAGGCFATSVPFLLNVLPVAEVVISGANALCSGDSTTLTAETGLAPESCEVQWQSSTNGTTWTTMAGVTGKQIRIAPTSNTFYRAQAICSGSFCSGSPSNVLQVTVVPAPSISVSGGGFSCVGGTMVLSATASGGSGNCGIQWQSSTNGSTWVNIPSATGTTLNASPSQTTSYRAVYSCSGAECGAKISNAVSVEIFTDPVVSITGPQIVCRGMPAMLRSTISGGTGVCKIVWKASPNGINWDTVSAATGQTLEVFPSDTMYYKSSIVCSGLDCSEANSEVHMVVVADGAAGADDTLRIPSCARATYDLQQNINLKGNAIPTTFTWTAVNNANVGGESTSPKSGPFINDLLTNFTKVPQTVLYRVNAGENNQCPEGAFTIAMVVQAPAPIPCVSCINEVSIALGDDCRTVVTPEMVLRLTPGLSCPDITTINSLFNVTIDDGNGDNVLERCGNFRYVVSLKPEYEDCYSFPTCEGRIIAKDLTAPMMTSRTGVCARVVPLDQNWTDTLLCTDMFSVQNNLRSWQDPTYAFFTGAPVFEDICSAACSCNISLTASDRLDFFNCNTVNGDQIWARLTRTFRGTDCSGNSRDAVQTIFFSRPQLTQGYYAQSGVYEIVVNDRICQTPTTESMVAAFKQNYYIFNHPNSCGSTPSRYAYFQDAVLAGKAESWLSCNYSFQVEVLSETEICSQGKLVRIAVRALDACGGAPILLDTFQLKAFDAEPPSITSNFRNVVIATRPDDCAGSFGVDIAGLNQFFGIRVTDNCIPVPRVNTEVWYYGQEIVNGVPGGEVQWRPATYPRMMVRGVDGRDYLTVTGALTGRHKLVVTASDSCKNMTTREFEFTIQDQTVPVMVCQEMVRVSLANTQGSQRGYGRVAYTSFDKGSVDNCGMRWIRVRRVISEGCFAQFIPLGYDSNKDGAITAEDGVDWNKDGDINDFGERFSPGPRAGTLYTPLLDYVDFFCCDLGLGEVELWGEDINGNQNVCVSKVLVEDRIEPQWILPMPATARCDQSALINALNNQSSYLKGSTEYNAIINALGGDLELTAGGECTVPEIRLNVEKTLKCNAGFVDLSWTITKSASGQTMTRTTPRVRLTLVSVNEYNIHFPSNVVVQSCNLVPEPTLQVDQLGCDALSILVEDKTIPGIAGGGTGYTISRTFVVVNWCQFDGSCTDPKNWAVVVPRDTGTGAVSVLIRDRAPFDGNEEIYFDFNRNRSPEESELISNFTYNNANNVPCPTSLKKQFAWIYTQTIAVLDNTPPVVSGPASAEFATTTSACTGTVSLNFTATDNCGQLPGIEQLSSSSGNVFLQSVFIKPDSLKFGNLSEVPLENFVPGARVIFIGNQQWRLSGDFPEGNHRLTIRMRDAGGSISLPYVVQVSIRDGYVQPPACVASYVANLLPLDTDSDGRIDAGAALVEASALIGSPIFDCNGQGALNAFGLKRITKYSVSRQGQTPSQTATNLPLVCANLGTFVTAQVYSWDEAGNFGLCTTVIFVTDSSNACVPRPGVIQGRIATEEMVMVEGAEVQLGGGARTAMMTKRDGSFYFDRIELNYNYTVAPYKRSDYNNGVSTLDLIRIKEHILGVRPLKGPYKMIAADVNNSRSITTLDMLQVQRLILNLIDRLPGDMSWRFIASSHVFSDPSNPWNFPFPETLTYNKLQDTIRNANFVAIKLGDVSGDAVANTSTVRSRTTEGAFEISVPAFRAEAGQILRVPLTARDRRRFLGAQFTLEYDRSALRLMDVEPGLAAEEHMGVFPEDGVITMSWIAENDTSSSDVLATLVFRVLAPKLTDTALKLSSRLTPAEAYGPGERLYMPTLVFEDELPEEPLQEAELFQNAPNPFSGSTLIKFWLPEPQDAILQIFDLKGRVLYRHAAFFGQGLHEINIDRSAINGSGVLFYTLKAGSFTATKKMLLLE